LVAYTLFVSLVRKQLLFVALLLVPCCRHSYYSQGRIGCSHFALPYHCACSFLPPYHRVLLLPWHHTLLLPFSSASCPPHCCFINLLLYCRTLLLCFISWYSLLTLLCKWRSSEQHQQASSNRGFFFPNPWIIFLCFVFCLFCLFVCKIKIWTFDLNLKPSNLNIFFHDEMKEESEWFL
jgi:hypothetical protein